MLVELMRGARSEKVRLDATMTLLGLAGVRPGEAGGEERAAEREKQRPAVLLNLFVGVVLHVRGLVQPGRDGLLRVAQDRDVQGDLPVHGLPLGVGR